MATEDEETRSHTSALSFKDRILNRRVRGRGKKVKADMATEAPIVFPKLKFRKLDETGEFAALVVASMTTTLAGAAMLVIWLPAGAGLLACGAAAFGAYLLGCRRAPPTEG